MKALALQTNEAKAPAKRLRPEMQPVRISDWSPQPFFNGLIQRNAECACGGGCPRCAQQDHAERIQTKLQVSSPGDVYEQEADRVAEQIMRLPGPGSGPTDRIDATGSSAKLIQRECYTIGSAGEEEMERGVNTLQTKKLGQLPSSSNVDARPHLENLSHGGRPLSESSRNFFEPRFGYSFGHVRIHNDAEAARLARAVNARAYTLGRDIVFGAGQYEPNSIDGKTLLAHELAHVVQQSGGSDGQAQRAVAENGETSSQSETPSISRLTGDHQASLQRKLCVGGGAAGRLVTMLDGCSGTAGLFFSTDACSDCPSGFRTVEAHPGPPTGDLLTTTLWNVLTSSSTTSCWRGVSGEGSVFLDQFTTRSFDVADYGHLPRNVPSAFPSAFTRCEGLTHAVVEFWNADSTGAGFPASHALGLAAQNTFRAENSQPGTMVRQVLVGAGHGVHEYSNGAKTHVFFSGGNVTSVTHEN